MSYTFFLALVQAPSVYGTIQDKVLGVWLGLHDVHNLTCPVQIMFQKTNEVGSKTKIGNFYDVNKAVSNISILW